MVVREAGFDKLSPNGVEVCDGKGAQGFDTPA